MIHLKITQAYEKAITDKTNEAIDEILKQASQGIKPAIFNTLTVLVWNSLENKGFTVKQVECSDCVFFEVDWAQEIEIDSIKVKQLK